jgi:hypothetical protein
MLILLGKIMGLYPKILEPSFAQRQNYKTNSTKHHVFNDLDLRLGAI